MDRRRIYICLLFLNLVLLTGCWDRVEIEERGFVIGTAIDLSGKTIESESGAPKGEYEFIMTNQLVIPGGLGGVMQGGGQKKAYLNISESGGNMLGISRDMASKSSRTPFYEHLQILIISSGVAKTPHGFRSVIDFFIRDHEMRRGVKMMIAENSAKKVLEIEPESEKLPVMYLNSISMNDFKNAKMLPSLRIGEIHEYLLNQSSFVVPRVTRSEKGAEMIGSAVFHGHNEQMVGVLNKEETKGLNLITGQVKSGSLETMVKDHLVVYEIQGAKSKIEANIDDKENIVFNINIQLEGKVAESFVELDFTNPKILNQIEKNVGREIERLTDATIKKAQEELKTDFLGLGDVLSRRDYDTWKQIEHEWDHGENYFVKSEIKVETKAIIRTTGSIINTESN